MEKIKGKPLLWIAVAAATVAFLAAVLFVNHQIYDRKKSNFSGRFELYVYPDMEPAAVLGEWVEHCESASGAEQCAALFIHVCE